ncbi:MAG: ATP-binding protein [Aliiglaciecola sp.]|uniref:ATP-binding protein n=1 Tax=Aliiglaciecola sp. TaxID=1872441 RepID=UPI00329958F5
MKLIHKFFLAFFVTNIILVGLLFVFIYSNFSSEFNQFIEQEEQKHVVEVKQQLLQIYSEFDSWQPIVQNSELWRAIVDPRKPPAEPRPSEPNSRNNTGLDSKPSDSAPAPKKPNTPLLLWSNLPADILQTGKRISLYDQHKNVVVGRDNIADNPHLEPLLNNDKVIGWIGLVPSSLVENSSVNVFLAAQLRNYLAITVGVILLAFVMAIVLSRHLSKPIKQLVDATNELKDGNYHSRVLPLTQDELGTLSENVNKLASTLEQNQQMRFQWISDTSHELRTPLTVLRSHLLAVQDGVFVADEKRINVLINQVNILNHIVDDLAQLATSDLAYLTYNEVEINLVDILEQTIESFTAMFDARDLSVSFEILATARSCTMRGDKDRLQQLFTNLLENACRYTHKGGQVNIQINKQQEKLTIIIEDSAPAVSTDDLGQLFHRFYRVEKSRSREHGGSGLGLSICKKIVEAHGGKILLENSPLGGLKVKVTFFLKSNAI